MGGGRVGGRLATFVWSVATWPPIYHRFVAILSVIPVVVMVFGLVIVLTYEKYLKEKRTKQKSLQKMSETNTNDKQRATQRLWASKY